MSHVFCHDKAGNGAGRPQHDNDGNQLVLCKTATDGKFSFSVPAGVHTVKVEKANHTFKDDGRLLDGNGNNYNYQQPMNDIRFWDQTKVKLIGRVAGGTVEQNKQLGYSL